MEFIEEIFFRKVNPSDFKKLYDIDKPESGGGQTYLEATGVDTKDLVEFLSYGEISDSPLPKEERKIYTINAYVLGKVGKNLEFAQLEFAPRGGRNNYRISRQTASLKHPAWKVENGFPEPKRGEDGEYKNTFEGIIDDLCIFIIRTSYKKYYASFINMNTIPTEWPKNIGLENMFRGDRRGIIKFPLERVRFKSDKSNPFEEVVDGTEYRFVHSKEIDKYNRIIFGAPGTGKSHLLENDSEYFGDNMERVTFHPNYSYASFVGTYKPTMMETSDWLVDNEKKKIIAVLQDKSMTAQEKYDLLYDKFKDEGLLTRLPLLLGIYTDEDFKTRKLDGTDAEGDNSVERNHGKAIRPYLNLKFQNSNKEISYEYVPGPFMRIYTQALNHPKEKFLLLIEEINRANVAAVFGDIFQLLDRKHGVSEYPIATSEDIKGYLLDNLDCLKGKNVEEFSDEEKEKYFEMRIPSNMYIWATMNSADQGVFPMDTAFKRRWEFEYIGVDDEEQVKEIENYIIPMCTENTYYVSWQELRKEINTILAENCKVNEDKLLGPFFISRDMLEEIKNNKVVKDKFKSGDISEVILEDVHEKEKGFIKAFESKVIMYLFEDVMRMRPQNIFIGHEKNKGKMIFSKICEAFEKDGEKIFGFSEMQHIE